MVFIFREKQSAILAVRPLLPAFWSCFFSVCHLISEYILLLKFKHPAHYVKFAKTDFFTISSVTEGEIGASFYWKWIIFSFILIAVRTLCWRAVYASRVSTLLSLKVFALSIIFGILNRTVHQISLCGVPLGGGGVSIVTARPEWMHLWLYSILGHGVNRYFF